MPFEKVHALLRSSAPELYPEAFAAFDRNPLGTGTVAQVHRAELKDGTPVVVRLLKPRVRERIEEDARILRKIAPLVEEHPDFKDSPLRGFGIAVEEFRKIVLEELDILQAASRQEEARLVYARSERDFAVEVPAFRERSRSGHRVLVSELAQGVKFSKFFEHDPEARRRLVEKVARVWLDEAFFGSGFFHADLHEGNILVRRDPQRPSRVIVTLLDFGLAGRLEPELRGRALRVYAAHVMGNREAMSRELHELLEKPIPLERIRSIVDEEFDDALKLGRARRPADIMAEIHMAGGRLPMDFGTFARGFGFIEQLVDGHLGGHLDGSGSGRFAKILMDAAWAAFGRDAPARLGNLALGRLDVPGRNLPLSNREVIRLGSHICARSLGRLLGR